MNLQCALLAEAPAEAQLIGKSTYKPCTFEFPFKAFHLLLLLESLYYSASSILIPKGQ